MKANRHAKDNLRNDAGEVGIGTMIVFIAAVIVAAIAAAVLVNTAGNLQRKASETGGETTDEVAANIFVRDIIGYDDDDDNNLDEVYWYISLAPGADPIDLNQTVLRYKWNANHTTLAADDLDQTDCDHADYKALSDGFCVRKLRQDSADGNTYVLSPGDRVRVEIHLTDDVANEEEEITTRETVDALFIPETGSPVDASFSTPTSLGGDSYMSLV